MTSRDSFRLKLGAVTALAILLGSYLFLKRQPKQEGDLQKSVPTISLEPLNLPGEIDD